MKITIIASIAMNGIIGIDNCLPWNIPEEVRFFREKTMNKPVVIGRKTFECLDFPMKNRKNVVLTRSDTWSHSECIIVKSVQEVIDRCKNEKEIVVVGGQEMFQLFLEYATDLCLSVIPENYVGDVMFPYVNWTDWELVNSAKHHNKENVMVFEVRKYKRKEATCFIV